MKRLCFSANCLANIDHNRQEFWLFIRLSPGNWIITSCSSLPNAASLKDKFIHIGQSVLIIMETNDNWRGSFIQLNASPLVTGTLYIIIHFIVFSILIG